MNEQIMHVLVVIVELNELFGRKVGEMYRETPRYVLALFVYTLHLVTLRSLCIRVCGVCGLSARVEVVEET